MVRRGFLEQCKCSNKAWLFQPMAANYVSQKLKATSFYVYKVNAAVLDHGDVQVKCITFSIIVMKLNVKRKLIYH